MKLVILCLHTYFVGLTGMHFHSSCTMRRYDTISSHMNTQNNILITVIMASSELLFDLSMKLQYLFLPLSIKIMINGGERKRYFLKRLCTYD